MAKNENDKKAQKAQQRKAVRDLMTATPEELGEAAVTGAKKETGDKKPKNFKQVETKTFMEYGLADEYRKTIPVVEGEKIRVKYRRERGVYDVVLFRLPK